MQVALQEVGLGGQLPAAAGTLGSSPDKFGMSGGQAEGRGCPHPRWARRGGRGTHAWTDAVVETVLLYRPPALCPTKQMPYQNLPGPESLHTWRFVPC